MNAQPRPHMIGGSFEDVEEYEPQSRPEPKVEKTEGTLFFSATNTVQIIENTTTQADNHANTTSGTKSMADAFEVFNKLDKPVEVVAQGAQEVGGAIWDLFKTDIVGVSASEKPKDPQKAAEEDRKKKELVLFIKQQQAQQQADRYAAVASKKAEVEKTMVRMGVSHQEVVHKTGGTTEISVSNIFWVAINRVKQQVAKRVMPAAGKGKAKQGLQLNSSAQEGQSLVSSSGAIASAG